MDLEEMRQRGIDEPWAEELQAQWDGWQVMHRRLSDESVEDLVAALENCNG